VEDDAGVSTAPTFSAADRPADIVDGAGRWLADQLGVPFEWSRRLRSLQAAFGPLTLRLGLQGSQYSRTGESTTVSPHLRLEDEGLHRWRLAHPEVSSRDDATLINLMLANVVPSAATVELYGQLREFEPRILSLPDFVDLLYGQVLSVLPILESPVKAVRALPEQWWLDPVWLVEWALSRDDRDSARQMVERYLSMKPDHVLRFRKGMETNGSRDDPAIALGRATAMMGLIESAELPPVRERVPRRTFWQRLRGDG
jgi:hypothetical protein